MRTYYTGTEGTKMNLKVIWMENFPQYLWDLEEKMPWTLGVKGYNL